MRPAILLALAVVATAGRPASAQPAPDHGRVVDSLFADLAQGARPGLAVAVVRDGRVVLRRGYGMASLEHRVPITPSTVFDVASVSKQFAGLAIAMLVEQGRVRLDADVRTYVPEMGDVGHPITVRHLVHHTSGLRDWPGTLALAGWRFDDVISFDQILAMAYAQRSLNFVPGAEYTYSNTGYNLLAEIVTRVTGQPFAVWTEEHLFRPLGMTRSRFQDDHGRVIPDRASGYARAPDGTYRAVPDNLTALGSSSLYSTVDDLARWVANFDDPKVGGGAAMARARTRGVLNDGTTIPYAYGLSHGEHRGRPTVAHSGGWAQFSTYLLHVPAERLGVIVLANGGGTSATRAALAVADAFLGVPPGAPTAARSIPAPAPTVARAVLDGHAGLYRLGPGWYLRVRRDGDALRVRATREEEAATTARADTSFWVEAYGAPIDFARDGAGRATHLVYRGSRAPRVPEPAPLPAARLGEYAGTYASEELDARWVVAVRDGGLVMRHRRHGTIALAHLAGDDFGGSAWFLRSVEFRRDEAGRVTGLSVYVDERSRDVRFARVSE